MNRGRGRGRGGWGRGRGQMPGLRDDEGNLVPTENDTGPPHLFPEIELPEEPVVTDRTKLLLLRRADLLRAYKSSPYYIDQAEVEKKARDYEVERYSDKYKKKTKRQKPPLASILTLDPTFFPEELYSDKAKKLSATAQKSNQDLLNRAAEPEGRDAIVARLNQLAEAEKAAGGDKEGGAAGAKAGEGGDAAEQEDLAANYDDDDEEVMEDDDYYQGEHFDDDEGYDDGYDDGGDDGPIY